MIWGVAENEVEYPLRLRDETQGVLAADLGIGSEGIEVAAQRGERPPVPLDEERRRRPARQCLDPERAGARVEVEHARAGHVAENREERLAHAIRGGARAGALRRMQPATLERAGDDPHGECGGEARPAARRPFSASG